MSCGKEVQTSETDTNKTIVSITPIPSIEIDISNDGIENTPDIYWYIAFYKAKLLCHFILTTD